MLVTKAKFLQYQDLFYKKLMQVPYQITLEVVSSEGSSFMDTFVGDSERKSKTFTLRALYEKEISDRAREKYGIPKEVNGIVYLSPKQLIPLFGDYHLDWNTTKIHFEGSTQVISKIVYLEEFKEYNGCVGIQIFVKDDLKGG